MSLTCPHCGDLVHTVGCVERCEAVPTEGDVAVCFGCNEPAVYAVTPWGVVLRSPTADELVQIHARPEMHAIRSAFQAEPGSPWVATAVARWQLTADRHEG